MSKLIPLQLSGEGYSITSTPEAQKKKQLLLFEASEIKKVSDNEEAESARYCLKELNDLTTAVEKCRKEVKEPVLLAGKKIDEAAKDFVKELDSQKFRITTLISDHAKEQQRKQQEALRLQQEAEAEAQRKYAEEEARRVAAEEAALKAEQALMEASSRKEKAAATKLLEEARAREAEAKRAEAEAEAAEKKEDVASMVVLAAAAPKGVKPSLDYEVIDIHALYRTSPHLVELSPKRKAILDEIKSLQDDNLPVEIRGLKIIETFKVSSR